MADRTAVTTWSGGLEDGKGESELRSSGAGSFSVSWPSRAESPNGQTSPEELVAAAHSSCFSMALAGEITRAGGSTQSLETTATVTLDTSSLSVSRIALQVRGTVDGLDADGFQQAAQTAKENCPISKLVSGATEVTLDASLT